MSYGDDYRVFRIEDGETHWCVEMLADEALKSHGVDALGYETVEEYLDDMGPVKCEPVFFSDLITVRDDDGTEVTKAAEAWAVECRGVFCSTVHYPGRTPQREVNGMQTSIKSCNRHCGDPRCNHGGCLIGSGEARASRRWTFSVYFEPRDLWVGMYWNRESMRPPFGVTVTQIYVCLIPCFPIKTETWISPI